VILVAGGTGTLGSALVPRLMRRGLPVRVLTRTEGEAPGGVEVVVGDVRSPADAARAVRGARTVVSAATGFGPVRGVTARSVDLEGNRTLIAAAREAGAEHVVLLSVHGAAPGHPIELFRLKYEAEQVLRASGLAWTIVRPAAYLETWTRLLGEPLREAGTTRVFGHGENPINFVAVQDVAEAVERAVLGPSMRGRVVDVVGSEDLTMNEVVARFQSENGVDGTVKHVPRGAMRMASVVLRPFNASLAALIRTALAMDTIDMTATAISGAGRAAS
jgi:uncharacterized protein YbjT (DUF2867 family)